MIEINNSFFFYILWVIIGLGLAYGFVQTQKESISFIKPESDNRYLIKLMGASLARISVVVIVVYFAFMQSTWYGITCLLSFVTFRWIFLLMTLKKIKG